MTVIERRGRLARWDSDPISEIDILWLPAGLSCDGDTIAERLARSQAPVKQIITGTVCHLEAAMVQNALEGWDLNNLDFLFIENVGNLVCLSCYDLGADLRFVLLSVTEGEDKPLKYPTIFNSADVAVITKSDLAAAVEFDEAAAKRNIQAVRPGMEILKVSAKTGEGMALYVEFLESRRTFSRRCSLKANDASFEPKGRSAG
jgi:hydrogenase nickel incorporation protein HypB